MITLEEIAGRLIDTKDYDFTANKTSWEPQRADNYVLPAFVIKESQAKGAEAKLRTKLSKILAFVDLVKHKRFKTGCTIMPISVTGKDNLAIWNNQMGVSRAIEYMMEIGLISLENDKYQFLNIVVFHHFHLSRFILCSSRTTNIPYFHRITPLSKSTLIIPRSKSVSVNYSQILWHFKIKKTIHMTYISFMSLGYGIAMQYRVIDTRPRRFYHIDKVGGIAMNRDELILAWKAEEKTARIHGWDFSHIDGRYTEQDDLPWDYRTMIRQYLRPEMKIMDIDTGGGEFLLSLNHPHENTAAMENYPPNVELCKEVLLPLGIDFRSGDGKEKLPFEDGSFDMVINRHGDFNAEEIYRVLKPGGLFITQQVGAENDRELVELLCGKTEVPFPDQYLKLTSRKFENAGFTILRGEEVFRPIRFFDVGALVWFARIIQWEFPGFSVDTHLERLLRAQKILEEQGSIDGTIHRFLLVARK